MAKKLTSLKNISALPHDSVDEKKCRVAIPDQVLKLAELQDKFYAQGKYSLLVIFQGMDASGKDGAVRQVFSGINPAGCNVKSFKVPTEEEMNHDFLWRIHKVCPQKGMIQIFNRSHYEDILVPSVHRLLPPEKINARYADINAFEHLLVQNGTILLKFFLHVSEEEQMARIGERKTNPHKRWKYQEADIKETVLRKDYLKTYDSIFKNCSLTKWHIVPADKNWYKNYFILKHILEELDKYDIHYPTKK